MTELKLRKYEDSNENEIQLLHHGEFKMNWKVSFKKGGVKKHHD
jgi:hypothetical protein